MKTIEEIPINKDNDHAEFIPSTQAFEDHENLVEQISIGVNNKIPVLMIGETGTGKTSLVRYLAHKTNNSFRRVNHNGGTTVEDILGRTLINKQGTYWIDGVLVEAMRKGFWYLADELNAASADILFAYHSLLDDDGYVVLPENGGEIVRPHANFRFFSAMNPMQEYVGTKELNKALLSRFLVIKIEFPPPNVEEKILVDRTGISSDVAKRFVKYAAEVRAAYQKETIRFILSTRDLLLAAKLFTIYKKYIPAIEIAILNKTNSEETESVKDSMLLHFKALDEGKEVKAPKKPKEDTYKFKVGDYVRVNDIGSVKYIKTKMGWQGVVIAEFAYESKLRIQGNFPDGSEPGTYDLEIEGLDLITKEEYEKA